MVCSLQQTNRDMQNPSQISISDRFRYTKLCRVPHVGVLVHPKSWGTTQLTLKMLSLVFFFHIDVANLLINYLWVI
jgi:hypothetical protein